MTKRAVTLLSGGLDSVTTAFIAKNDIGKRGELYTLSFYYGQLHEKELELAREISELLEVENHTILDLPLNKLVFTALTGDEEIPVDSVDKQEGIPVTWVPQRNTLFLTLAAAYAETVDADFIYIGVNALDYSGYPDCRPEFIEAMNKTVNLASKRYIETGRGFSLEVPIIRKTKAEIIQWGTELGVPYQKTWSCYKGGDLACGRCDSCILRLRGFSAAGLVDPIAYEEFSDE